MPTEILPRCLGEWYFESNWFAVFDRKGTKKEYKVTELRGTGASEGGCLRSIGAWMGK